MSMDKILEFMTNIDKRLSDMECNIDKRFDDIDKRFNDMECSIDKRFNDINKRFNDMEDSFDKRIGTIEKSMDDQFNNIDTRLGSIESKLEIQDRKLNHLGEDTNCILNKVSTLENTTKIVSLLRRQVNQLERDILDVQEK